MKKYIELVKKFLADNDSVTEEELKANKKAAYRAADEADWASRYAVGAAARAFRAAYRAALWAFRAAESDDLENAEYHKTLAIKAIAEYEELTR